jgi:hypothetical protein
MIVIRNIQIIKINEKKIVMIKKNLMILKTEITMGIIKNKLTIIK